MSRHTGTSGPPPRLPPGRWRHAARMTHDTDAGTPEPSVLVTVEDGVATITLNCPEAMNAISPETGQTEDAKEGPHAFAEKRPRCTGETPEGCPPAQNSGKSASRPRSTRPAAS